MGLSRLSSKCRSCKYVEICDRKEIEALAYIDDEQFSHKISEPIIQPILKESEILITQVSATGIHSPNNGSIRIDKKLIKDEINKALHKEFFMPLC